MKKKISVFTLLLLLMLAFVVPSQIKAADDEYTIEEWCSNNGYECKVSSNESWSDSSMHFSEFNPLYDYIVYSYNGEIRLSVFGPTSTNFTSLLCFYYNGEKLYSKPDDGGVLYAFHKSYKYSSDGWSFLSADSGSNITTSGKNWGIIDKNNILYSSKNIYLDSTLTDVVFAKSTLIYDFKQWCNDTGLNTYDLDSNLDYFQIVRKNNDGTYHLTTIGNYIIADNYTDYTLILSDEGHLQVQNLYSGDDENGYLLCLSEYEYMSGRWDLRSLNYYDSLVDNDFIYDFGAGSGLDMYTSLVFNNVDIYSESFELIYPAIAKHQQDPIVPNISPTPSPTTAPGSSGSTGSGRPGSGSRPDTGGQATGGGGLDFIINLFTLIWTKICSIPMAVDGYSINLQQIVIYGTLVSIVGGFIMHFIFGRK